MHTNFSTLSALLGLSAVVSAHTWIEAANVISPNGTFVGAIGYARGNVLRTTPGFADPLMVNLIPPNGGTVNVITPQMAMCMPSQQNQVQTAGSPRLQAAPGAAIALRYQENGHVSLPANQPGKPPNRGTVYVYGTTQPSSSDSLLAIHRVWNAQGTGGDGRGVLLSSQNFDDGQCYQVNGGSISVQRQAEFSFPFDTLMGSNLWCQQDIALPANAPTGQPYTLYWVWDWPTMPGTAGFPDGKQEIYTTCIDVDIVDTGVEAVSNANSFVAGQDLASAAISSEMAEITNPTAVVGESIAFSATAGGTVATTGTFTTSPGAPPTLPAPSTSAFQDPGTASSTTPFAGATATQPAAQSSDFGGHHSHTRGGSGFTETGNSDSTVTSSLTSYSSPFTATNAPAPTTTAAPDSPPVVGGGVPGEVTVTEMDSLTLTVLQTVFNTTFNKRYSTLAPLSAFFIPSYPNVTQSINGSTVRTVLPFVSVSNSSGSFVGPIRPMFVTSTKPRPHSSLPMYSTTTPGATADLSPAVKTQAVVSKATSTASVKPKCTAKSNLRMRGRNALFVLPGGGPEGEC